MWSHLAHSEGDADARNISAHDGNASEDFVAHGDSQAAHGVQRDVLAAANQDSGLAEVDQLTRKADAGRQKADPVVASGFNPLRSQSRHRFGFLPAGISLD